MPGKDSRSPEGKLKTNPRGYTGLRVSELIGLRWDDVGVDSITIDERYCRGDWAAPKSSASNATIGVDPSVIERIHQLKQLSVRVRAGRATRTYW
jgi:integrase